jgi:two-component system, OmpR family, phosphate regulon sensor histidine kinase PhoR
MRYNRLVHLAMGFVVLIFVFQVYLMGRLFQVNRNFLNKQINLVCQEAYTIDMNNRLRSITPFMQPKIVIEKTAQKHDKSYNIDQMENVNKKSSLTLVNLAMETYLSKVKPLQLSSIDSVAAILLKRDNIFFPFYSQIIDLKRNKILATTKNSFSSSVMSSFQVQSNHIPLNFQGTKVLQLVFYDSMKVVFYKMVGIIVLSFILTLFCIYCFYKVQQIFFRQKKLAQTKNDFYHQVSHELKRPVSVLYAAIDSLMNTNAIDNKERREKYLRTSMNEINKIKGKIDMILTMSMNEEGMFKLNKSEFSIVDLVYELKDQFDLLKHKPLEIFIEDKLTRKTIFADKEHISQCLSNLIENAIKYSDESVDIKIKLTSKDNFLYISVSDNGLGIKKENFDLIFEKFARVDSGNKAHGYGIGLSYVKQIVEKHGGKVVVESELGKGSTFIISLPVG